jgi:hypothetical protein
MFVHVFTVDKRLAVISIQRILADLPPFTFAVKCDVGALLVFASHLAIGIPWRLLRTLVGVVSLR